MNETNQYILDQIKIWVWSGFYDEDDLQEMIEDILEEDADEEALRAVIPVEMAQKIEAEQNWPTQTDCDRLDSVFERLQSSHGILCLQNTGYTMSDGLDDTFEALDETEEIYQGYCFYHGQDLERAIRGERLYLAFGSLDNLPDTKTEVGHLVQKVLSENRFLVEWNGDPESRLKLQIDWKRRFSP